eukprot:1161320-Pelagomonas_calceolata.AAC.7
MSRHTGRVQEKFIDCEKDSEINQLLNVRDVLDELERGTLHHRDKASCRIKCKGSRWHCLEKSQPSNWLPLFLRMINHKVSWNRKNGMNENEFENSD